MRFVALGFAVVLLSNLAAAQDAARPLTPAQAAKKIDTKVTVEMEVKSTGGNNNRYLNSASDYRDASNFTIFIPKAALDKFKKLGIDDPAQYFKGKTVQVTGTVALYEMKPQIRVEDPTQIKIIEKK